MSTLTTTRIKESTIENVRILRFLTNESAVDLFDRLIATELDKVRNERRDKIHELFATRTEGSKKK